MLARTSLGAQQAAAGPALAHKDALSILSVWGRGMHTNDASPGRHPWDCAALRAAPEATAGIWQGQARENRETGVRR